MTKQTLLYRDLNLLPLRKVLLTVSRDVPARAARLDVDEQRAASLIERMKASSALANPFDGMTIESPRPNVRTQIHEMAEQHA